MNTTVSKTLALSGVCVLIVGAGATAFGQPRRTAPSDSRPPDARLADSPQSDFRRPDFRRSGQYRRATQAERRRLDRLHAAYARAAQRQDRRGAR